jgi:hypothetical protein
MKRAWSLGVAALLWAVACSNDSGGGHPLPDGGCCTLPDGGIPDGGGPGPDGGPVSAPLQAIPDRVVIGTTPGAAKSAQLSLKNVSGSPVTLQSLDVSGNGASAFQVSGATLPAQVAPGATADLTVAFNGTAGVSQATLTAATAGGNTAVPLGGLATSAEPSLQWIFDVHNIPVKAGNPDPTKKDLPAMPTPAGDEILVQSFVKAGDGPVTLQLIGSFGPSKEPVSINGWYASGNAGSRTELFRIAQANAQVLDPPIENGGTLSFDPGSTPFGFWNTWPFWGTYIIYQEDALNTWDTGAGGTQHHMRVYPYRNPDGTQDPHAYIVTTEEAMISIGPDYNDVIYIVRNVVPRGSGGAAALQLINQDGLPSSDRMMFSLISTIAACWGPLTVKDTGVVTVTNLSGNTVNVSAVTATDAFTVTTSAGLPAALAPGASMDVTVKFVATDGRVHTGTLTVNSDDPSAPARTMTLAGFRQEIPQNATFPTTSTEPDFDEVVNGLYGYSTVVGTKQLLIDVTGQRVAIGDEVLSSYWVKADPSQPVTMRLMSAWHSGWDCAKPSDVSFGSFAFWFPKGRASKNDDRYILGGAKEDIQRVLPRQFENPANPAAASFDPGAQQFGFHIELEFSDESLLAPADIEPWCTAGQVCGHRMRFWPVKDASGALVPNTWLVTVDMHVAASPGVPFFSNYDYNDETYLVRNMMPAPP